MITQAESTNYLFDGFRIDVGKRLLYDAEGRTIPLKPKVFDTLLYLVSNNGTLIEKGDLMSAVWPDTIVEENNLNKNISVLRRALGERPNEHRFIITIPGKGYKFAADVRTAKARPLGGTNLTEFVADILTGNGEESPRAAANDLSENEPRNRSRRFHPATLIAIPLFFAALIVAASVLWRDKDSSAATGEPQTVGTDRKIMLSARDSNNVEANEFYEKGRLLSAKLNISDIQAGIKYFQQAIAADPSFALAYVGLAESYRGLATAGEKRPEEYLPKAKEAALKAVQIDDNLAEAHAILGFIEFWQWDWKVSEEQFQRALELNPKSADTHRYYAHLLSNTGHHDKALAEIRQAREIDPVNFRTGVLEGQFLIHAGQSDEGLTRLREVFELDTNFWLAHLFASSAYIEKGKFSEAVIEAQAARKGSGPNTHPLAFEVIALAKAGREEEARTVLKDLQDLSAKRFVFPYHMAQAYNGLGDTDNAFTWLNRALEQHDPMMVFLKVEPKWNNLRSDPRFTEILKQMHFPE